MIANKKSEKNHINHQPAAPSRSTKKGGLPEAIAINIKTPTKTSKIEENNEQSRISIDASEESFLTGQKSTGNNFMEIPYLTTKKEEAFLYGTHNDVLIIHHINHQTLPKEQETLNQTTFSNILSCLAEDDSSARNMSDISLSFCNKGTVLSRIKTRQELDCGEKSRAVLRKYDSFGKLNTNPFQPIVQQQQNQQDNSPEFCRNKQVKTAGRQIKLISVPSDPKVDIYQPKAKGEEGKNRMKLKDYIYQTQIRAKNANIKRNIARDEITREAPEDVLSPCSPQFKMAHQNPQKIQKKTSMTSQLRRQSKNEVTNIKMYNVIRQDIHADLRSIMQSLKQLQEELMSPGPVNPSNDELVLLYKARQVIKEQLMSRVESLKGQLTIQKENRMVHEQEPEYRAI